MWRDINSALEYLQERGMSISHSTMEKYCRDNAVPAKKQMQNGREKWMVEEATLDQIIKDRETQKHPRQIVPDGLLNTEDAAAYIRSHGVEITADRLRAIARRNTIPSQQTGRVWAFRKTDLHAYIARRQEGPTAGRPTVYPNQCCPMCGVLPGTAYTAEQATLAGFPELEGQAAEFYDKTPTGKRKTPKCRVCHLGKIPDMVGSRVREKNAYKPKPKPTRIPTGYTDMEGARQITGLSRQRINQLVQNGRIRSRRLGGVRRRVLVYGIEDLQNIASAGSSE